MKRRKHGKHLAQAIKRPDLGLPPGSPVYVGDRKPTEMVLSIIGYDPIGSWTKGAATVDELLSYRNPAGLNWINVNGLRDSAAVARLAQELGIHALTVEDILNTEHRPKLEEFDKYLFFTFKAIGWRDGQAEYEQISLILTRDTVVTFQETAGDNFDPIRRRIDTNVGRIRKMGPDYLAYCIIDSVVDAYFLVLDQMDSKLEDFESRAIDETGRNFMREMQETKQAVLGTRRAIWPLRENLSALLRLDNPLISDELAPFLKDLHDNAVQAAETVESFRELMANIMEVNLSSVSIRMNEVMKVLTIISTIFIPLTFIAGVYGMNFNHMPELDQPWAYPAVLGLMLTVAVGLVAFFKRKKWI
jgi:magnesium transporter